MQLMYLHHLLACHQACSCQTEGWMQLMYLHHLQEIAPYAQQFVLTLQAWRCCDCQDAEMSRRQLNQRVAFASLKLLSPSPELAVADLDLMILELLSYLLETFATQLVT